MGQSRGITEDANVRRVVKKNVRRPEVPSSWKDAMSSLWQSPPCTEYIWKREFKLPWREAGPLNHHDDIVDSDQSVVNKQLSLSARRTGDV